MEKIFKWAELAHTPTPLRFEVLSEYLNEKGFKNEFSAIETKPFEIEEVLSEALKNYQALRLGSPYGIQALGLFDFQPAFISYLQAADSILKKGNNWELMASTVQGFERQVIMFGKNIDLNSSVLIVGSGASAKFAIHTLIKIGIKKIYVSNQFAEQAHQLIEELEKKYFGVKLEFVPEDQLVLLPGSNSVLVNTTPLVESNNILKELYYFNFLKPNGLAIDFTFVPINTPLVKGAQQIGIRTIKGYEICAWGDLQWAKNFCPFELNYEEYELKIQKVAEEWEKTNYFPEQNSNEEGPRF